MNVRYALLAFAILTIACTDNDVLDARLIAAARKGDQKLCAQLLKERANPNARERLVSTPDLGRGDSGGRPGLGNSALNLAVDSGKTPLVRFLISKGASVNGKGLNGYGPLATAASRSNHAMVKLLLKLGANPNAVDDWGNTTIDYAANRGDIQVVDALLRSGAMIDGGSGGMTPLMGAAYNNDNAMVRFLLKHGANPNVRRFARSTAYEQALLNGNEEGAAIIRKADGKGRSKTQLDKDNKPELARWDREREANLKAAERFKAEQVLTQHDRAILRVVIEDFARYQGKDLPMLSKAGTKTYLVDRTVGGVIRDFVDQLIVTRKDYEAQEVSLEMRENLARRNPKPVSLIGLELDQSLIAVKTKEQLRELGGSFRLGPLDSRYIEIYLPGYSADRRQTAVPFRFGPSAHGAAGTYLLEKKDGAWIIRWRSFAFYV